MARPQLSNLGPAADRLRPMFRAGVATDPGLVRARNEDRSWIDEDRGIFLVVDGMGGHAAGEVAAETAVATIRQQLASPRGAAEDRLRRAIVQANNEILRAARLDESCRGMACVLTLALLDGDDLVIGHVGDSRLYLVWNGSLRKLTSDHSPVGAGEDAGELTEEEAMLHPRRNEVYRDVGSQPHDAADEDFIEIRRCQFKPGAAFLLCSDGLSDRLTSAAMREIIDRYDGDPDRVARELVAAANEAGGQDNITVVFVAGPEFQGGAAGARVRHSTTRLRRSPARGLVHLAGGRTAFLLYGLALGTLAWFALSRWLAWIR